MARTDVDVCNLAIGKVGGEPIEAIGEDSPLGVFCQLNYPAKAQYLLGMYDWRFATIFAQLTQIAPTPAGTPLKNLFGFPSDLVGDIRAFRDGPTVDACDIRCLVSNIGVASNHGAVYAEYTALVPEARWPVWFVELVATAYAADLAQRRPDTQLAQALNIEAFGTPEQNGEGGKYLTARQADGRNAPQRALFEWDDGALVDARVRGFGHYSLANRPIIVDTSNG